MQFANYLKEESSLILILHKKLQGSYEQLPCPIVTGEEALGFQRPLQEVIEEHYPAATLESFHDLIRVCKLIAMVLKAVHEDDFRVHMQPRALIKDELKFCLLTSVLKSVCQLLGKSSQRRLINPRSTRECVLRYLVEILGTVESGAAT